MSSENKCTCTFTQKMVGDGCSVCNPDFANGSYSESMGVDTRPAHKLEFGEHWILFSPSMSVEQFHQCADAVVHELKTPMDPLKNY